MTRTYTHQKLGEEVTCIAGYYTPRKEFRLKAGGREVLTTVGCSVVDGSCCGMTNWDYAIVPGYVLRWHAEKGENGMPITEVEPITDLTVRAEVTKALKAENIIHIDFW